MRLYGLNYVANQKARKVIDNAYVVLNKIHLSLFTESLRRLFPSKKKKKLTSAFYACICPLIDDKFHHNIFKVRLRNHDPASRGSTATLTVLRRNL